MTVRFFLFSALLAAATLAASVGLAQTAQRSAQGTSPTDLYHQGAKLFVDGDNTAALSAVESGLAQAPNDARLQALRDLIQQQQDESDQQDDSQDQQDGEGEQNQDGEQDESQDSEDGGSEGESQDDRSPETEQDGTSQQPPQPSDQGQGQQPQQAGEPAEMTQAQADRLLDAVGGDERLLLREMRRAPTQRRRGDKDW